MIAAMRHSRASILDLGPVLLSLGLAAFGCGSSADDGGTPSTGTGEMGGGGAAGDTSSGSGGMSGTMVASTGGGGMGTGGNSAGSGGQPSTDAGMGTGGSMTDAGGPVATDAGLAMATNTARPIGSTDAKNGYWEYLPKGYGDGIPSPLLVFWHGIGENGSGNATDLNNVQAHGPPKLIKANQWPGTRPFVVLSPQHSGNNCPSATEIHDFITFALGKYQVDSKRVYLTGLSCGALGSASYFAMYGGSAIAASALISGDATPIWDKQMCGFLTTTAYWAFHGDMDQSVNISGDNTTMPKFIACPKPPKTDAQYTVYPGAGHDVWTQTYDLSAGPDIYTWFLTFHH
jgi:poly(3-hydroxybutyrate) depolymerase